MSQQVCASQTIPLTPTYWNQKEIDVICGSTWADLLKDEGSR